MDSNLTVADAKTALARFQYPDAEALRKLNRVSEHFLKSDLFTDLFSVLQFTGLTGCFVTMPRGYGRAYGVIQDGYLAHVRGEWRNWTEIGFRRFDPGAMSLRGLNDLGNHFVTQSDPDPTTPGTLRAILNNVADAGMVVRFNGTTDGSTNIFDTDGNLGLPLTATTLTTDTTQLFKTVTGIQATSTKYGWTLWQVISGVPTQIGSYEPGETRPRYIRYQVSAQTNCLRLFCRRQYVPLVADTDWLYPANIDAFEHGFNALGYRDRGDLKGEMECWEAGLNVLKAEYAALVPPPEISMSSDDFGAVRQSGMSGSWG